MTKQAKTIGIAIFVLLPTLYAAFANWVLYGPRSAAVGGITTLTGMLILTVSGYKLIGYLARRGLI